MVTRGKNVFVKQNIYKSIERVYDDEKTLASYLEGQSQMKTKGTKLVKGISSENGSRNVRE